MIRIRRSDDRGRADRGWLDARFTFSFADYHDPEHMGFRALRVLNEDRIAPGKGFGPHAHRDMEIVTYVLEGGLRHRDSMGGSGVIRPNQIQLMSAGSGVVHSEFNASDTEPVHLLQIWIVPSEEDRVPSYQQIGFDAAEVDGRLRLLAAPDAGDPAGQTIIGQDVRVYAVRFDSAETVEVPLDAARHAWLQVARGSIDLNSHSLEAGDGVGISAETRLRLAGGSWGGECLLFDLG